ncbi:hypothetical protein Ancab_008650 [Ancistrocladus abbreviatus]
MDMEKFVRKPTIVAVWGRRGRLKGGGDGGVRVVPTAVQHTIATQGRIRTLLSSHHMLETLELDDCQITSDSILDPPASLPTSSDSTTSSGGQGPLPQCTIFSTAIIEFVKKETE